MQTGLTQNSVSRKLITHNLLKNNNGGKFALCYMILVACEVKYQETHQVKINRGLQTFLKQEGFDFAVILTERNMELRKQDEIYYYLIPLAVLAGI